MSGTKRFFGMSEDEAYEDYLKFCEENGYKLASKEEFTAYMDMFGAMPTEEEDGN